jgi:hypothetical protein
MAKYYEYPLSGPDSAFTSNPLHESTILYNTKKILLNDENIKPIHIANPAQFTEFHIIRGSDTLFLNIGESWTYGETLEGIGTAANKFNFRSQVEGCFGPRVCETMGWDLYQFAIPGNCNLYMHLEIPRLLEHVATLGYKKVYFSIQLTENARELPICHTKLFQKSILNSWFDYPKENNIDVIDWLAMYQEALFDNLDKMLKSFTACPIEAILWGNFIKIATKKRDYSFKIIEPTWIKYTASLVDIDLDPPYVINAIEFDKYKREHGTKLNLDQSFMEEEMNKIEFLFDYIGNKYRPPVVYHSNHPSKYGHLVWAHHLIRQAGWKNI